MASATLAPYKDNTSAVTFVLVSSGTSGSTYKVDSRDLACPYLIEIKRELTSGNATGNDHVKLRIARTERNATTTKLATMQVLVDVSIPKDTSILTITEQKYVLGVVASLINDCTVNAATTANRGKIVGGQDL